MQIVLDGSRLGGNHGRRICPGSAQSDLDEALEIAENDPMTLFLADIHFYRARMFAETSTYPWDSPHSDLAAARRLIERHGYLIPEPQDAENAMGIIRS